MKQCTKCRLEKPYSEFKPNKNMRSGYDSWCRKCHNAAHQEWYLANRDMNIEKGRLRREAQRAARPPKEPVEPPTELRCAKCYEIRPVEEFYPKKGGSGYRSYCKQCFSQRRKAYYQVMTNRSADDIHSPDKKACSLCGLIKLGGEFGVHRGAPDGLSSWCKECARIQWRESHKRNKFSRQAYNRIWRARNPNYSRIWRRNNPEKYRYYAKMHRLRNIEKVKARQKAWRKANEEKVRTTQRLWRQRNLAHVHEWRKRYRQEHEAHIQATMKIYREKNREQRQEYQRTHGHLYRHLRRARLRQAEGSYTRQEWEAMLEWFGHRCLCCGATDLALTVDHVVPLSRYGTNYINNLQPLCLGCNLRKHTKSTDYRNPEQMRLFLESLRSN